MVETAIVLSAFVVLTFGIFEYGRILMIRQLLQNAAREGGRQAMVGTSSKSTATIQTVVTNFLVGAPATNVNIQVYATDSNGNNAGAWTGATFGNGIAVQVNADVQALLPTLGLLSNTLHLQVKSIVSSEAY
jgi:Flp pilus assembly protein TadG